MRLIDADALIERVKQYKDKYGSDEFPYDIVHDAFIYEVEKEPTVEAIPIEWIPVNERLPKDEGSYIVSCTQADISYSSTSGFIYDVDGNPEWLDEFGVVAWMPLPTPYERKED